jgi:hypothetical protein
MSQESLIRDHCQALVDLSKITNRGRRRPFMNWEVKTAAEEYLAGELTLQEIAERMNRPVSSVYNLLSIGGVLSNRLPARAGVMEFYRRRSEKVIAALLAGDSWASVCRRWDMNEGSLYEILWNYKHKTRMNHREWKRLFFRGKCPV